MVRQGAAFARVEGCGVVIAFGGGSAIDAGRAMLLAWAALEQISLSAIRARAPQQVER